MKKLFCALLTAAILIMSLTAPALAVSASANQKLSFRTGPNTRYVELYTLPQSTSISVIESEYGNGVQWVLCEFYYNGDLVHAYTGLKRVDVYGMLPRSNHYYDSGTVISSSTVYSGPTSSSAYRGKVGYGEMVNVLKMDGNMLFIEFYDASNKAPSRGWVSSNSVISNGALAGFMTEASSVYSSPSRNSSKAGKVGQYEMVGYLGTENGYDQILFYKASNNSSMVGYVPTSIVDCYY